MAKDLIREMLNKASKLLSEGRSVVEWFDPKSCEHRGAFQVYLETRSWPAGFIPESVSMVPGFRSALVRKLNEAFPEEDIEESLPEWARQGIQDAVQSMESGEMEEMTMEKALDIIASKAYEAGDYPEGWLKIRDDVKLALEKYGIMEGKVPAKDDDEAKILKKLTEAGIKENEIRDIWVVTRPSEDSTMEDVVSKSTPQRLMLQARGGLDPEDLIGVYDNAVEARKRGSELLSAGVAESKVKVGWYVENSSGKTVAGPMSEVQVKKKVKALGGDEKGFSITYISDYQSKRSNESKVNEGPDGLETEVNPAAKFKDPGFKGESDQADPGDDNEPAGDMDLDDEHAAVEADFDKIYLGQDDTTHFYVVAKKGDGDAVEDLLITDQEGKELFSAKENGIETHDVGKFILAALDSDKVKVRELERGVVLQYLVPKEEEVIAAEEDEEDEDLEGPEEEGAPKMGDQSSEEGTPAGEKPLESKRPTKESRLNEATTWHDLGWTDLADDVPDLTGWEVRSPRGDILAISEWDEKTITVKDETGRPIVLRIGDDFVYRPRSGRWTLLNASTGKPEPMDKGGPRAADESKQVQETVTVKDVKGNTFTVSVVDEGSKDTVVQINNREFRFKPDFVSLYEMDGDQLTEKGLQDMAAELLSHLREDEYAEVVGSGVQKESVQSDEEDHCSKCNAVLNWIRGDQKWECPKCKWTGDHADKLHARQVNRAKKEGMEPSVGSDMTDEHDQEIVAEYQKLSQDESLSLDDIIDRIASNIGVTVQDVKQSLNSQIRRRFGMEEGKVPSKDDDESKIVKKLVEGEYSDMTALTKDVFQVDFVLDSGEKRRTRVMAFDDDDAKTMLKRQRGVKDVTGTKRLSSESKVKEGAGELRDRILSDMIQKVQAEEDADNLDVFLTAFAKEWSISREQAVELYNQANDEQHLDTGNVFLGQ